MKSISKIITVLLLSAAGFFFGGCSSSALLSDWDNNQIYIDGIQNDWGKSIKLADNGKFGVGFKNNEKNLFILFKASDREIIFKTLIMGMTIWLEPEDGEKIGIKFPLSNREELRRAMPQLNSDRNNIDEALRIEQLLNSKGDFSIVNEDDFTRYLFSVSNSVGFKIAAGFSMGQFVYELQVPLAYNRNSEIVVDAVPGQMMNVTIQTNKFEMADRDSGSRPGMNNPGMQPGGRGMDGQRSAGKGRNPVPKNKMEPLEYEVLIQLANNKI
ncbi:MAG: hypothetical protein KKD86_12415 [Bacteroidetes bacterium]|nr:hypothetical protein [Bacteroidota bacterium]